MDVPNDKEEITEEMKKVASDAAILLMKFLDTSRLWDEEKKKSQDLLERNFQNAGRIIQCHLVLENRIDHALCFLLEKEDSEYQSLRLRFTQKVKLLPKSGTMYSFLLPGIIQLNHIRNGFAHNLEYQVNEKNMEVIDKYMPAAGVKNSKELSVEQRIEKFTELSITFLSTSSKEVMNKWNEVTTLFPNIAKEVKKLDLDKMMEILSRED